MKLAEIPHPFVVYVSKFALFVFQLYPYFAFQSTVSVYQPITKLVSIDLDLFASAFSSNDDEVGDCVLPGMGARTKIMSGQLVALEVVMFIVDMYRLKNIIQKIFNFIGDEIMRFGMLF